MKVQRNARADGATGTAASAGFDIAGTIASIGTAIGAIFTGAGAIWGSGSTNNNQQSDNGSYTVPSADNNSSKTWFAVGAVGLVIIGVLVYFIIKKKK
ncbi:MAG: hypothetical protein LBF01_00715 [Bacteroidales bacterium]|jgi:hypothetical protein|nr:hypothetical protein [Bacteroidales bacterium]